MTQVVLNIVSKNAFHYYYFPKDYFKESLILSDFSKKAKKIFDSLVFRHSIIVNIIQKGSVRIFHSSGEKNKKQILVDHVFF